MKRGRPKLPAKDRKSATVIVRLQDADRASAEAAANRSGTGLSEWIRATVVAAASDAPKIAPKNLELSSRWLYEAIRLEVWGELSYETWEKLVKVVEILKPERMNVK